MEITEEEEYLCLLVDYKIIMNYKFSGSLKTRNDPRMCQEKYCKQREVVLLLSYKALVRTHLEYCA